MLSRTAPIRTFVRLGASSPLKLAPKYASVPFSSVALKRTCTPYQQCSLLLRNQKNTRIGQIRVTSPRNLPPSRSASTTTTASNNLAAGSATAASESQLTWNRFLALRKQRRRISLLSSISSAIICLMGGATFIVSQDIEKFGVQIYGFDTITVLGLATLAFGLTGWLLGPFLGNAVFNTWHRRLRTQIAMKEREFFTRIKRYRVDPTSSSISNPVPDYYGERIGSVKDYRRWLKDQRAFNLKRGRAL